MSTLLLFGGSGCFFDFFRGVDLEPGDIAGRLVDDNGEPVAFARVSVGGVSRLSATELNGRFVVSGLRAGTWTVTLTEDANGDGWPERAARRTATITVERHADGLFGLGGTRKSFVDLGDVVLVPAVDLTGTVERDGAPAPGAVVVAAPLEGDRRLPGAVNVGTDDEGGFRFVLPTYPFEIVAFDGALSSDPVTVTPTTGDVVRLDPLVLEARSVSQDVELDTWPERHESLTVAGRTLLPAEGVVEQSVQENVATPVALTLPVGTHDLVVRDDEGDEALLSAQVIPSADGPVRIGAVDLGETACRRRGEDCDGDGLPGLPPADVVDNIPIYATCALQCGAAWGSANVGRGCFFGLTQFDCDDDGDGQPDTTEPAGCHGPGRGGDLDGDGTCDTRDVFPRCRSNDPEDPLCSPFAAAPRPGPREEYVGPGLVDGGPPPSDAGPVDGGAVDGGDDAGPVDGGEEDGGLADAGDDDSGVVEMDAGPIFVTDGGPLPDGGCAVPPAQQAPPDLSFAITSKERAYIFDSAVGPDGHIYVGGRTGAEDETFRIGRPGAECSAGPWVIDQHPFLASLDATGACRWLRLFPHEDVAFWRLAVTADGFVVAEATHGIAVDFGGGVTLPDNGTTTMAVLRVRAADGLVRDAKDLAPGASTPQALKALPDGAFAVAGFASATTTFGAGEPNETTLSTGANYVAVYECDLSLRWLAELDPEVYPYAIAAADLTSPAGTHVFVASEMGDATIYPGTAHELTVLSNDTVLVALGPSGDVVWTAVAGPLYDVGDLDVSPDGTLLAVTGESTGLEVWSAGSARVGIDGGPGDPAAHAAPDPVGYNIAGVALYDTGTGQAAGAAAVTGDSPYAYGLAFTSNTSLAIGGFVFADVPVSGPEGPDAGVSATLQTTQGAYVAHLDVTDPAAPSTRSIRVPDSVSNLWIEQGAISALPDGSVVASGYVNRSVRQDGVAELWTVGTDWAWVWRSRDGDEAVNDQLTETPCGPSGNPLAGEVFVEIWRGTNAVRGRFGYSAFNEWVSFDDVTVPPDGGPVAFADDRYLADGVRITAAGGRYAHPDFGFPAEYAPQSGGPLRYAPGPIVATSAPAPAGANLTEVTFETGTCNQASTTGFGATFVDADNPSQGQSALRVYDANDTLIHEELITTGDGEEEQVAIVTVDALGAPVPAIFRVEIVNGQGWPWNDNNEGVVLDDFRYRTPLP